MYSVSDIRKGTFVQHEGQPYRVLDKEHVKMGRGGAVLRTKLKNLVTGSVLDVTWRGSAVIEPANVLNLPAQYLYREGDAYKFMDTKSFEQFSLGGELIGEAAGFMKEGAEVGVIYFKDKAIGVEIPVKVALKVASTGAGARGDTATAALKDAVLETGYELKVPLFVDEGDSVRVDTRTGKYIERV